MKIENLINELENNKIIFRSLLENINEKAISWKLSEDKWSILEITCHLYDEEREDFRARIDHILKTPQLTMPSINPQEWVYDRNYSGQNYPERVKEFLNERSKSIAWLQEVVNENWQETYMHPKVGPVTAELILVNWIAHDYLHIRQLIKNKYMFLKLHNSVPLDYAGEW